MDRARSEHAETRGEDRTPIRQKRGRGGAAGGLALLLSVTALSLACAPDRDAVVLIVVDTLRADHLGHWGHDRDTSPRLDAWASSARVFGRTWATSPWTLPSFGSLLTGELPARHAAGVRQTEASRSVTALDPALPTLAEVLGDRGWATAAIVNNPWLDRRFGLARGFDLYDHAPGGNARTRRADVMVDRSLAWIDAHSEEPFFLLVHFFDPHMSYDAPPPFRGRFTGPLPAERQLPVANWKRIRAEAPDLPEPERRFIAAAYDEEVAFVDSEIGRLLRGLERREVLERGLVVLTSDHGEELFEHDGFEHGHAMWEELLWVPLMFWGRDVRAGNEQTPVSLVDIAPTILEAVGVPRPNATEGVSLWPNLEREVPVPVRRLYAEQPLYGTLRRAALQWPYKLEYEERSRRRRFFDLESDPHETRRAGRDHPQLAAQLLRKTRKHFATLTPSESSRIVLPERDLEDHLRSLGYLE